MHHQQGAGAAQRRPGAQSTEARLGLPMPVVAARAGRGQRGVGSALRTNARPMVGDWSAQRTLQVAHVPLERREQARGIFRRYATTSKGIPSLLRTSTWSL